MITIQTIIDNNTPNMEGFFKSLEPLNPQIIVINLGASSECIKLCEENNVEIYRPIDKNDLSSTRNELIGKSKYEYHMFMHPWETILQGWDQLTQLDKRSYNISVIDTNNLLSKEGRIFHSNSGIKFVNPVFEHLNELTKDYIHLVLSSSNDYNLSDKLDAINEWRKRDINNPEPYYYQALCYMSLGDYSNFIRVSSHYMHLNKKKNIMSTMNKYYFSLVNIYILKKYKPAIQNITQCLDVNPLMAEFWCLVGDIYYYIYRNYDKAKHLYDNALILGSRRRQDDIWPMDISKYFDYPSKMIDSCNKIINNKSYFIK